MRANQNARPWSEAGRALLGLIAALFELAYGLALICLVVFGAYSAVHLVLFEELPAAFDGPWWKVVCLLGVAYALIQLWISERASGRQLAAARSDG